MHYVKKHIGFIIVIILGLLPLFPLLHPGLVLTHDGQDHVARIANFYASLSEGNIIPRWAGNLNWGYGHPILMFLYPLPSYLASSFHFLGLSLVDSIKLVFAVTFIGSGIGMYLWIRNIFGDKAGMLVSILYMYAPYRFVDLYVRGAIGEHVAFLFIPFVFYFALKQSRQASYIYLVCFTLSIAGLLLSHNAIALMFLPLIILYAGYLIYKSKDKIMLGSCFLLFGFLGFGLSSFFLIPAFLEGKYTLRDIVTGGSEYRGGFVKSILDFIIPSWSFSGSQLLSKQIGSIAILAIVVSIIVSIKYRFKKEKFIFFLFSFSLIVSLVLMLSVSDPVWQTVTLIQKFQFPWRLLSVVTFAGAVLSAFPFLYIKNKKYLTLYVAVLTAGVVLISYPYYQANGWDTRSDSVYTGIYKGTTDTGESSPIWSVRFMEHAPKKHAEFIDGTGSIQEKFRNSTQREYAITVTGKTARIRENTLYFPNWEVFVNRKKVSIEFQDRTNRGLITYYVPPGENTVKILFEDTKIRKIANAITIVSLTVLLGFCTLIVFKYMPKKGRKLFFSPSAGG